MEAAQGSGALHSESGSEAATGSDLAGVASASSESLRGSLGERASTYPPPDGAVHTKLPSL